MHRYKKEDTKAVFYVFQITTAHLNLFRAVQIKASNGYFWSSGLLGGKWAKDAGRRY